MSIGREYIEDIQKRRADKQKKAIEQLLEIIGTDISEDIKTDNQNKLKAVIESIRLADETLQQMLLHYQEIDKTMNPSSWEDGDLVKVDKTYKPSAAEKWAKK